MDKNHQNPENMGKKSTVLALNSGIFDPVKLKKSDKNSETIP